MVVVATMLAGCTGMVAFCDGLVRSMIVPEDEAQGGHTSEITVSAFSPDGRYLATAALDG